ncbi:MAG TPA: carbon-nitrogen hydrolase family protein [Burkholderiaceae bacterium]|nr:carbon-nitrogen hydrolase family protein [Burkholderiaceae bacterium]
MHRTERRIRVAAVQMVSTASVESNLRVAGELIAEAVHQGAQFVVLPEYFCLMGMRDSDKVSLREAYGRGPIQSFLAEQAARRRIWLVGGTLPLSTDDPDRVFNSVLVHDPTGRRVARYDKIHLFSFRHGTETYDEARTIVAGREPVLVSCAFGDTTLRVGLSVCYDLRFPELYRRLREADLLVVPAAFTAVTGQAHWEALLRARAIENLCYVLASAQGGRHENGRVTFGHSMLVDPWGEVLAVRPSGAGVVVGTVDPARIAACRANLPALAHRVLQ